jgi:hypothetical protein
MASEPVFRFVAVRTPEAPDGDRTTQPIESPPDERSPLETKIEGESGDPDKAAFAAADYLESSDSSQPEGPEVSALVRAVETHRGRLDLSGFASIVCGWAGIKHTHNGLIEYTASPQFKRLKSWLIDQVLAREVLRLVREHRGRAVHNRLALRDVAAALRVCRLIELAAAKQWPFPQSNRSRDVLNRITLILPLRVFRAARVKSPADADRASAAAPEPTTSAEGVGKDLGEAERLASPDEPSEISRQSDAEQLATIHKELSEIIGRSDAIETSPVDSESAQTSGSGILVRLFRRFAPPSLGKRVPKAPQLRLSDAAVKALSKPTKDLLIKAGFSESAINPFDAVRYLENALSRSQASNQAQYQRGSLFAGFLVLAGTDEKAAAAVAHERILTATPDATGMFYFAGIGDLLIVRQDLIAYELGDFAHVENILAGEKKERTHRRLDLTEEVMQELEEQEVETERDLQSTTKNELSSEAQTTLQEQLTVQGNVSVSGSYGGTVTFTASAGAGFTRQTESSETTAARFSQEVVERAAERVRTRVLTDRRSRIVREIEETNLHGINNTGPGAEHIRGVYRWLNKVYRAQVYNYGRRAIFEFVVPEPAAFYLHSLTTDGANPSGLRIPVEPAFGPRDITRANWLDKVKLYDATSTKAPPPQFITVGEKASGQAGDATNNAVASRITIPDGYEAFAARILHNIAGANGGTSSYGIGTLVSWPHNWWYQTFGRVQKEITFSYMNINTHVYAIGIDLFCELTKEALEQWQLQVYDAIAKAYKVQKTDYEERLASAGIGQGVAIQGRNPAENATLVRNELQRACLSVLTGRQLENFNPFIGETGPDSWRLDFARVREHALDVLFFQHAFEWENLSYVCYPYFWGRASRWAKRLHAVADPDPALAAFLRAGAARVQLPVRPGFEEIVLRFAQDGFVAEDGEEVSLLEGPTVAIVDEIKAAADLLSDATPVGDPWEVTLPTTLTLLQDGGDLVLRDVLAGQTTIALQDTVTTADALALSDGDE